MELCFSKRESGTIFSQLAFVSKVEEMSFFNGGFEKHESNYFSI